MFIGSNRSSAVAAVFGSQHSSIFPNTLYLGFNNTSGEQLGTLRVQVPNTDAMWMTGPSGVVNQTPIVATAPAAWIIGSVSFWSLPSGGNQICTIALPAPLTVESGADLSFPVGSLKVSIG